MLTDEDLFERAREGCHHFYRLFQVYPQSIGVHSCHKALMLQKLVFTFPLDTPHREVSFQILPEAVILDELYFRHMDRIDWISFLRLGSLVGRLS
jgi:hypothetical protein